MAGLQHFPETPPAMEQPHKGSTRLGYLLFLLYLMLYGGFMLLNAFTPSLMESTPLAGVNLAVLYGLGLIVTAFVLAVLYDWCCPKSETKEPTQRGGGA